MMPTASDQNPNRLIVSLTRATRWLIAGCLVLVATTVAAPSAQAAEAAEDRTAAVAGRVLDPLGGAIAHATVTLIRDDQPVTEATSDESGRFALTSRESGRYRVHVAAQGFESRDTTPVFVAVGDRVTMDLTLSIGPLAQQVVVSANATALPESQVGASVTVLDRGALQSLGKPDVLEALRLVPGVQMVQTGQRGGTASLFVRGGNANFNKVIVDGVPANEIGGTFDFANLPVSGVERVEVLRNPNSVLYGADALTSVVSITTRRGMSRVPELSYAIDGGNLGTVRQDGSIGGANGRIDYFADFSHFDTATTSRMTPITTARLPARLAGRSPHRRISSSPVAGPRRRKACRMRSTTTASPMIRPRRITTPTWERCCKPRRPLAGRRQCGSRRRISCITS
jgi:vitamin B12 transporter